MTPTRLGVIGWPISHSRSPAMQSAALRALSLDWEYAAHAVAPADLAAFLANARAAGFRGLNVTIPHKESAFALCHPDALATQVGAVNTLVFEESITRGYNTDVHGFLTWATELSALVPNGSALILGSGGAARAVASALHPTMRTTIISRAPRRFSLAGHDFPVAPYESLATLLPQADLLIDTTPRGLDPTASPPDLSALPSHAQVLDLVVATETALTRAAKSRGLRASTGAPMLLHQGARSLELWTTRPAPLDIMRAALLTSLCAARAEAK
jgi:shikimate dehydrogenase